MTEGLYPHLKNCIGAIDGTHIRAVILVDRQVRYIGRTGAVTQNVMAICDFDMHFTYASIGQPGAMHDTSVLYHAIDKDRATFPHPPKASTTLWMLAIQTDWAILHHTKEKGTMFLTSIEVQRRILLRRSSIGSTRPSAIALREPLEY